MFSSVIFHQHDFIFRTIWLYQTLRCVKARVFLVKRLQMVFERLYVYTNQPNTGIRHALMDEDDEYVPKQKETLFMLVSYCALLNYLKKKE